MDEEWEIFWELSKTWPQNVDRWTHYADRCRGIFGPFAVEFFERDSAFVGELSFRRHTEILLSVEAKTAKRAIEDLRLLTVEMMENWMDDFL